MQTGQPRNRGERGGLANGRAPRIPSRLGCLTTWALCLHWDTKIGPWFARQLRCRLQLRRRLRLKFALSWNAVLRPVCAQPKATKVGEFSHESASSISLWELFLHAMFFQSVQLTQVDGKTPAGTFMIALYKKVLWMDRFFQPAANSN